jgi:exodeoxyribonuclease V alpha subunit
MGQQCTIDGTVLNIVYQNDDNGYTVLKMTTTDGETVTVVGCIPCAAPGEEMIVTGEWAHHPTHGDQIKAEVVERYLPRTESGILDYLSSGAIKGVGPATAQLLVSRFGEETLDVLELEPERLTSLKGITTKKAMEISESFRYQTGMRRMMEFLSSNGLPLTLAMRLYGRYGAEAPERIKENPYLLCDEFFGVDFSAADNIALSRGVDADEPRRVEAAVLYELSYNLGNGHVFLPREKLAAAAAQLIDIGGDRAEIAVDSLRERGAIVEEQVAKTDACYLAAMYEAETFVSSRLEDMLLEKSDRGRNIGAIIARIEKEQNITYAAQQRRAVECAAKNGVFLLTGGPGTGKTTCVRAIASCFEMMGLRTELTAPTGRAAKRLGELCGREGQTVHRLLGMSWNDATGELTFSKNENERLEADAVIVDETSMVDLALMRALLAALKPGCRLVLVGDPDQLPSVGAGNVFSDLIRSERIETVALTEIFRQAESSAIVRNAHAVNRGEKPRLSNDQNDFFFLSRRDGARLVETVVELCGTRLPQKMGIPSDQIQVLSPTRRGETGTANLNRALQAALNPPSDGKREKRFGDGALREGDRVMQIKNDYDIVWQKADGSAGTGVFNGDVGQITSIDENGEIITIKFDDHICAYTADMLSEIELAYAMTVHKSQGSEYRAVVLALLSPAPSLMVRGVLYTAITRAKELMIIAGDDGAVYRMAENDRQARRYSGLRARLKAGAER